jgi:group I intron endonuclease
MVWNVVSGVYEICNTTNNDLYIGSAVNLNRRKAVHWSLLSRGVHPNVHLQRAWDKYGESAFKFNVIITCQKDNCLFYEQQFLDQLNPAYNISPNASAGCYEFKDEDYKKSGIARRGVAKTDSWCEQMSKSLIGNTRNLGNKHSASTRLKMSQALIGNKRWLGKHHTEDTKQKISEALKRFRNGQS